MNAYEAEFLDKNGNKCICNVAETNIEKAKDKLIRLWDVNKVISLYKSRHLEVVNASPDGLDQFKVVFPSC